MIRQATTADIPFLAAIHCRALPEDLLPRLGAVFLEREFYPRVLEADDSLTLVAEEEGNSHPCAFAVFAYCSESLTRRVLRRKMAIARYLAPAALKHFSLIREILAHLKGFRVEMAPGQSIDIRSFPEVYLIAVHPSCQGRGLGAAVLRDGLSRVFREHCFCLAKTSSPRARRFYISNGFSDVGAEYRGKRRLSLLLAIRDP